jgi:hypothetical protein
LQRFPAGFHDFADVSRAGDGIGSGRRAAAGKAHPVRRTEPDAGMFRSRSAKIAGKNSVRSVYLLCREGIDGTNNQ